MFMTDQSLWCSLTNLFYDFEHTASTIYMTINMEELGEQCTVVFASECGSVDGWGSIPQPCH
jgi:hypothetical protein